jgi:tetratricopeptide (TPR) repeat protein
VKAKLGDFIGAIQDHSKAIQLDSKFQEPYVSRSADRLKLKDYIGAISDLNIELRLNPNDPKAYFNRGLVEHILN